MTKSVTFHCAFEDSEGMYIDPKEFTKNEAIDAAVARNILERDRLKKGKTPDAVWFVVKAETDYSVVARPEIPPRKKVVRRTVKKK